MIQKRYNGFKNKKMYKHEISADIFIELHTYKIIDKHFLKNIEIFYRKFILEINYSKCCCIFFKPLFTENKFEL